MAASSPQERLPTFDDRVGGLQDLAAKMPEQVRLWVEEHPAHLMTYCGWELQPFHSEGFEHHLRNQRGLWLAPRGSGKSTVLVFLAAWFCLARPENWRPDLRRTVFAKAPRRIDPRNVRIAVTSNSHPKAVALLWQIKKILTSEPIARLYGPMAGERWRDEIADTRLRRSGLREPTLTALGLGSKIAGGHYDVVICDDWVTLDNARTELQRGRIADFWSYTVKGTCEPWARVAVAGTRYHPRDWYGTIYEWVGRELADPWVVLRHPAITYLDDGGRRSYWPQAWPLEALDAYREEIGTAAFATQYQNEVDVMLGEFFESRWLEQFRPWAERPRDERESATTCVALDPAFKGGPKNDWSVYSVCHFNRPRRFHFERIYRGKWTQSELVSLGERIYREHRPAVFAVESVAGTEWLVQELRKSRTIPRSIVKPMPPRVNKLGRADRARVLFEQGHVWFDPPTPGNQLQLLLDELLSFTGERGGVDDCVDSAVWNIIALGKGRSRLRRVPSIHSRRR